VMCYVTGGLFVIVLHPRNVVVLHPRNFVDLYISAVYCLLNVMY
jgi:hypothetical protein